MSGTYTQERIMRRTLLSNDTVCIGYDKKEIVLGSVVQNIESHWIGRVTSFEQFEDQTMIRCHHECGGELEIDDEAWFDPADMVTIERKLEWSPLWKAMQCNPDSWIETTESMYYDMLNAVPPRIHNSCRFLVGEPHHDNEQGETVYASFKVVNDRYFAKYQTVNEYRS
jgi:hypothetical protein